MTPAVQTALESLVGRSLTADEVIKIDGFLPMRNDVEIANILSVGRVAYQSKPIGSGTILDVLMPVGGDFLDALVALSETNRNVYWTMDLIKQGRFDIGLQGARMQVMQLAQAMPQFAAGLTNLLKVAETPNPIQYNAVSDALNKAEGRMTL